MNKDLVVFTGALIVLTVVLGLVTVQWASPSFLTLILTGLACATWLVYFFMQKTNREDFLKNYVLTIVLKLLAGGIFIYILLYLDKSGSQNNAILFLVAYLLLTGLEVGFLFRRLN